MRWRPFRDWRYGRHSGIPACCRVFYVGWWSPLRRSRLRPADVRDPDPRSQYIRCPVCMRRGRFDPLHYCGPTCPPPWARSSPRYS